MAKYDPSTYTKVLTVKKKQFTQRLVLVGESVVTMESSTVLVIDDQPVVRHTLSLCLNNLGIGQVVQAQDGQEAKKKYVDFTFDVIFCDLDMPV